MGGNHDDADVRLHLAHAPQHLHPVEARHLEVEQEEAVVGFFHFLQGFLAVRGGIELEVEPLQRLGERETDVLLVVDDEGAGGIHDGLLLRERMCVRTTLPLRSSAAPSPIETRQSKLGHP